MMTGRRYLVPSTAQVLRRLHHPRRRDGQSHQLDGRQPRQTRSQHQRRLQRQLRTRVKLHADCLQQRNLVNIFKVTIFNFSEQFLTFQNNF